MEVLVLDGKNYVKASKAARDLGYATDYVGQLCRSNQVDAHLIGRTWYVNQEMLSTHKVEKKRISRVKAREHAKKTIEEHRLKVKEETNNPKKLDIRYESDAEELIPQTRKLSIVSTPQKIQTISNEDIVVGKNEVINEGDKVLMSGDIEVVDVTDGPIDTDTIILTPGRIKKTPPPPPPRKIALKSSTTGEESVIDIHTETESEESNDTDNASKEVTVPTFAERLQQLNEEEPATPSTEEMLVVANTVEERSIEKVEKKSIIIPVLVTLIILVITTGSLGLYTTYSYSSADTDAVVRTFNFSLTELADSIKRLI